MVAKNIQTAQLWVTGPGQYHSFKSIESEPVTAVIRQWIARKLWKEIETRPKKYHQAIEDPKAMIHFIQKTVWTEDGTEDGREDRTGQRTSWHHRVGLMRLLVIHKACMPVYKWSRFFLRTGRTNQPKVVQEVLADLKNNETWIPEKIAKI